ncbi:hypothetical protein SAMN05216266_101274 [Amycolatopsis marina]|uniref:PPE family protein n=1 Tax=Amycolatopsis marina TaxID=490629 RepID=A0A1I0VKQ4_9PSEU|nr:hypothetical protein SAMN05216266_101274 [Amycolatopsis marina]
MNGVPISVADISALVDRIRSHRFDGYTDLGLADEIDLFRAGGGTEGLGAAVDALKAVGDALVSTERTLREELGKLGVEWQSDAGIQAGAAIDSEAAFTADANEKVSHSAEMIFAQGEAFSRTLHKLPDAQTLREGAGGFSLGDSLFSLIGYETDHTRKVLAAREARQHALEALNGYARESGENLASIQPMSKPEALQMSAAPRLPGSVNAGGGPLPDTASPTVAANAAGEPSRTPTPSQGQAPAPLRGPAPVVESPAPVVGAAQRTAPPARGTGAQAPATTVPSGTAPSASAPSTSAPVQSGTGGVVGTVRPGQQPDAARMPVTGGASGAAPGSASGGATPLAPGAAVGGVAGTGSGAGAGSSSGSTQGGAAAKQGQPNVAGKPAVPGGSAVAPVGGVAGKFVPQSGAGTPGGQAAGDTPLAKGKSFGSLPQPTQHPGSFSGSVTPASGVPGRAGDLSGGIAALGAGGVAGALSGQDERKGRGVGRSAPGAARSPHQLPVGDLPEEEARVSRNSEKLNPQSGKGRGSFMERAAPQDGESDAGHVRKFGIDDSDLFADERMVAPDVISGSDSDRR